MRKIEFEELCKLYPVEYKQDKDYPQITVFRNGIIYNQKTSSVTGHIKQNRIDTGYGLAHQLVMKNFGTSAPEDTIDPTIDHIDELDFVDDIYGHHLNNDISNLQWLSRSENIRKAYKNKKWGERHSQKLSKPIRCIETGVSYSSQRVAAFYLGVSKNVMSLHLNGHRSDINGFHFERISKT